LRVTSGSITSEASCRGACDVVVQDSMVCRVQDCAGLEMALCCADVCAGTCKLSAVAWLCNCVLRCCTGCGSVRCSGSDHV
jgi:hypothetical protein